MQNKKVLILHGWGGSPHPHWQAWLADELEKENYDVSFPELLNKDFPNKKEWLRLVYEEYTAFNPDIVICHSLGNIIWFHLLKDLDIQSIDKLLLVAPVRQECNIEEIKDFFPYEVPKDLKAKKAMLIVSTNDIYMNLHEANELQHKLNIEMDILEDAGHINSDSGYGPLKEALDWIKE